MIKGTIAARRASNGIIMAKSGRPPPHKSKTLMPSLDDAGTSESFEGKTQNSVAPRAIASALLFSFPENTVTSQPMLRANWTAICPRPPSPTIPTRSVDLVSAV